eukprot:713988-Amphidinium_carterae.2
MKHDTVSQPFETSPRKTVPSRGNIAHIVNAKALPALAHILTRGIQLVVPHTQSDEARACQTSHNADKSG